MSVLGTLAAAATFVITGSPQAALLAYSIGSGVDSYINAPDVVGPRLEDLRTQMSTYGAPIPFEWGCNRHAGTIMWPRILEAVEHETTESAKGGPDATSFTYTLSCAVLVCEGPIKGVRRIWANKKLVYDASSDNEGATFDPVIGSVRFYLGTEDQVPDPLIEAADGDSPAYRGFAYVVFEDYDVTEMNGRPPQWEFEVIVEGATAAQPPELIGDGGMSALYTNPETLEKQIWSVHLTSVFVYDMESGDLVHAVPLPAIGYTISISGQEIWVGFSSSHYEAYPYAAIPIDPETYELGIPVDFGILTAVRKLGTVLKAGPRLYSFWNVSGTGGLYYPSIVSGISTPNMVYFALDLAPTSKLAIAGYGNWLVIASKSTDTTLATVYVDAWDENALRHRFGFDVERNVLYWANGLNPNVYKVDLDTYAVTLLISIPDVRAMHYNSANDTLYVDDGTDFCAYSAGSGALISTVAGGSFMNANVIMGNSVDVGSSEYFFMSESYSTWKVYTSDAVNPQQVSLGTIVSDICARAGLEPGEIDVSQLTDGVDGYLVARQMTARAAIEPLQAAYFFDAVEDDDKIKFVKRQSSTVTTIPEIDRAAREDGQELPDALAIRRDFELEVAFQCEVEYPDFEADHLIGTQYDRRLVKASRQKLTVALPIVMTAQKAKQVARVTLYEAWQNTTFAWATGRKYAFLKPTDHVELPTSEATYHARIVNRRELPNGVIEWEARITAVEVYDQTGEDATPIDYVEQTIFSPSATVLALLDTPILRDQDADKGFYVAMRGETDSWEGGQLFKSDDSGSTYDSVMKNTQASVIGTAVTALSNFTGGDIFDDGSELTVELLPGSSLVSFTRTQVLNGAGAFVLGAEGRWEVVQYTTATLVAPLTYTLSGFLRGRRGTEWAMSEHQIGDRFVFANAASWRYFDPGPADVGIERQYKAPSLRATLASATAVDFTDSTVRRRPYTVANLKIIATSDGHMISWAHRSLVGGEWRNGLDVALDAAFTSFSVTILDEHGVEIKQYTATVDFMDYPLSQALSDFGYYPTSFKVAVAQRNSDYGSGIAVIASSDGAAPPVFGEVINPTNPGTPADPGTPTPPVDPNPPPLGDPAGTRGPEIVVTRVYFNNFSRAGAGSIYSMTSGAYPFKVRRQFTYTVPSGHGIVVGNVVARNDMPEVYPHTFGYVTSHGHGPFTDSGAIPVAASDTDYADFYFKHLVRAVTETSFTLYDEYTYGELEKLDAYLDGMYDIQGYCPIAAGSVQRLSNMPVPATADPFAAFWAPFTFPDRPWNPTFWDGDYFYTNALGVSEGAQVSDNKLLRSSTGISGWIEHPTARGYHKDMMKSPTHYVTIGVAPGAFHRSLIPLGTFIGSGISLYPIANFLGDVYYNHVRYLNGQYLAMGDRNMMVASPDAMTWAEITGFSTTLTKLRDIDYQDGQYLLIGQVINMVYGSHVMRGATLDALTQVALPDGGTAYPWEMIYRGGVYTIVGHRAPDSTPLIQPTYSIYPATPMILRSTDNGATWTECSVDASDLVGTNLNGYLSGIVYCNGQYIATGRNITATSADGITWTAHPHIHIERHKLTTNGSVALCETQAYRAAGAGLFVTMYSTDGVNWSECSDT